MVGAAGVVVLDVFAEDGAQVVFSAISSRSVHSARTELMNRSAWAFICGACGAVGVTWMPMEAKTASNAVLNFVSRSRIR